MALVNTGFELAKRGKRVLIVDFDLEAPGITTFPQLSVPPETPGIVDFVLDYMDSGIAPEVVGYIAECHFQAEKNLALWVMPSGKRGTEYSSRFSSIDWKSLYRDKFGYLLMEDFKAQLKAHYNFDYVLIDSRTGYTDVGGICTRHLPDSVVLFFFPNDQNLAGLETIVQEIRNEKTRQGENKIKLHFVPSNVPDLDDEEDIVSGQMEKFRSRLKFSNISTTIHHYSTLQLLNQSVFTIERAKSSLAQEYRSLVDIIVNSNLEDIDAALKRLSDIQSIVGRPGRQYLKPLNEIESDLLEISRFHSKSGEVLFRMGVVRERMGALEEAEELYSEAISRGYSKAPAYISRAMLEFRKDPQSTVALSDIRHVFKLEFVQAHDLIFACRWLVRLVPNEVELVAKSPSVQFLNPNEIGSLAQELMANRKTVFAAIRLLEHAYSKIGQAKDDGLSSRRNLESLLTLCYISVGAFGDAIQIISPDNSTENILGSENIADLFNFAIAQWGLTGAPNRILFKRVLELAASAKSRDSANYPQCLALASYVVGDVDSAYKFIDTAERLLKENPTRTFSCWTYLESAVAEFRKDLVSLRELVSGKELRPSFLEQTAHGGDLPDATRLH